MTFPLNLGGLVTKQQDAVEVMLHVSQGWANKGCATIALFVETFALGALTAVYKVQPT